MEALSSLMVAGWDVRNNKGKSMPSEMPFSSAKALDRYLSNHSSRFAFNGQAFEEWQNQFTSSLKEYLGPFPEEPSQLNAQVVSTEKFEKFTLHKVVYYSRQDSSVPAYLLVPHKIKEKSPAVLCIHGHVPEGKAENAGAVAEQLLAEGNTACKFDPFHPITGVPRDISLKEIAYAENIFKSIRSAVNEELEVGLGTHGQLTTYSAIRVAQAIEPYQPFWFEEPVSPENVDEMARVCLLYTSDAADE